MKLQKLIQKLIDLCLLLIIVIFPISVNIGLISPIDINHPIISVNFSLADMVMGMVLFFWVIKVVLFREWKQLKMPPLPILCFILFGLLSFVNTTSIGLWLKENIQIIEYFLLYYILLINNLKTIKFTILKNTLFISISLTLFIATIQYLLGSDPYLVRGFFENRNILGTFLCIVGPLIYVELLNSNNLSRKIWMTILIIQIILILNSGSAMLALIISLFAINWILKTRFWLRSSGIIVIGVLFIFIMPRKNTEELKGFCLVYEQGSISENYYRRLAILSNQGKLNIYRKPVGENYLLITTDNFLFEKLPEAKVGERYREMEGTKLLKNRYIEMIASLNLISENPLLGVGLGNYQNHIGSFFKDLPKVNTAEPNQNNTYLIIASTSGILGLAAFLWVIMSIFKCMHYRYNNEFRNKQSNYFIVGLLGSIIAILVEGFFSMIFNASLMVIIVLIFYMSSFYEEIIINDSK